MNIEFERRARTTRPISLIPMVDILLVLIIYFLLSGSLHSIEILEISPPLAQSGEELTQGPLVIVLGKHDEVLINDELGSVSDIFPLIKAEMLKDKDRVITLKADHRIKASTLIDVMNAIREAGGENLTLATQAL